MSAKQGRRSVANMIMVLVLGLLLGGTLYSVYEMVAYAAATAK
jgi:hypothetical protein